MTPLDTLRKRILYRASHRGMRELDVVLAPWVAGSIERWRRSELEVLERILAQAEPDLLDWVRAGVGAGVGERGCSTSRSEQQQWDSLRRDLQRFLETRRKGEW